MELFTGAFDRRKLRLLRPDTIMIEPHAAHHDPHDPSPLSTRSRPDLRQQSIRDYSGILDAFVG